MIASTTPQEIISAGPAKLVDRRHPEWRRHHVRWKWLLDSLEGGDIYRQAIYGYDTAFQPIRNLIRHPHEYPDPRQRFSFGPLGRPPGTDQYAQATDDPYELRRARTPAPTHLKRTLIKHLSKVFSEDAQRSAPPEIEAWWEDVDGARSDIRTWIKDVVAPLALTLGQLDVICDHPPLPEGVKAEDVRTNADAERLDLNRVVASYLLPENVLWWKLDGRGRYRELLIEEPQEVGRSHYRHWTERDWTLYGHRGDVIEGPVAHRYGRPPIVRLFDKRRPRCKNVGLPRYEDIAEIARESYNAHSEVILAGTHGAHPVVMAPEDFCQAGETIPLGPNNLIPMKKVGEGTVNEKYEPWQVLTFDQTGADSLRQNVQDLLDMADLAGHLTKPAGASGGNGSNVVAQSGISKRMDTDDGNQVLGDLAETIERWDREITELFAFAMHDGNPPDALLNAIEIKYPKDFDLFSPDESAGLIGDYQQSLQGTGATPTADHQMVMDLYAKTVRGQDDQHYQAVSDEIKQAVARNAQGMSMEREARKAALVGENQPAAGGDDDGDDPGSSGAVSTGTGLQISLPTY